MSEVSPCIQILKLLGCMVKSAKRVISKVIDCFSAHVYIFGKGTAGRIGDIDGPNPARAPQFGDPCCIRLPVALRRVNSDTIMQLLWSGAPPSSSGHIGAL